MSTQLDNALKDWGLSMSDFPGVTAEQMDSEGSVGQSWTAVNADGVTVKITREADRVPGEPSFMVYTSKE